MRSGNDFGVMGEFLVVIRRVFDCLAPVGALGALPGRSTGMVRVATDRHPGMRRRRQFRRDLRCGGFGGFSTCAHEQFSN